MPLFPTRSGSVMTSPCMAGGKADMTTYVLYSFNDAGKISRSDPIEADNDEEALIAARALKRPNDCELWLRDRRIGRVQAAR